MHPILKKILDPPLYHIPYAKQNHLKHSFYYTSIATWNKLPVDVKSTNQLLSSFEKTILDIYSRNTPFDVLTASGVCGDTCVSVYREGAKGR